MKRGLSAETAFSSKVMLNLISASGDGGVGFVSTWSCFLFLSPFGLSLAAGFISMLGPQYQKHGHVALAPECALELQWSRNRMIA